MKSKLIALQRESMLVRVDKVAAIENGHWAVIVSISEQWTDAPVKNATVCELE